MLRAVDADQLALFRRGVSHTAPREALGGAIRRRVPRQTSLEGG
jgi:hypothetical protein